MLVRGSGVFNIWECESSRNVVPILGEVWESDVLSRNLMLRLSRSKGLSVLYGSEISLIPRTIVTTIQIFVNRCLRRIIEILWEEECKIRNFGA